MRSTHSGLIGGIVWVLALSSAPVLAGDNLPTVIRGHQQERKFEAVVNPGSRHVRTLAKDWFEARDNIAGLYCPDRDCIAEGPWEISR